jgi:hypothetical protein
MNVRKTADRAGNGPDSLEQRLARLADAGPQAITDRLNEIENEWSAGRMTKVTLGVVILIGLALAATVSVWWLILPSVGALFLLQYLLTRTSWLGAAFHELGLRTGTQIAQEKFALKALRGDFRHLPTALEVENKEDISRWEGEGGMVVEPEEAKPDTKDVVKEVIQAARC